MKPKSQKELREGAWQAMHEAVQKAADEMDAKLIAGVPFEEAVKPYTEAVTPSIDAFMDEINAEVESWRPKW